MRIDRRYPLTSPDTRTMRVVVGSWLRWWLQEMRHILTTSLSLVGATAVTSGLGFLYWWLAARQFPPAAVGFAAAVVSAMTLLGTVSDLGMGTMLMGELPRRRGREWPLMTAALLTTGAVGGLLGLVAALIMPTFSAELGPLAGSVGVVLLFALGVSLTGVTLVLDQALIGLLQGHVQFGRNAIFATAKLLALGGVALWIASRLGLLIYATWVIGLVVSLVGVFGMILMVNRGITWQRPEWGSLRALRRLTLAHYGLNIALDIAPLVLPLIVTALLTATWNAYFYTAWMIANLLATAPLALSVSLYAVSAAKPAELAHKLRLTLGLAALIGVLGNLVLQPGASLILQVFGATYAEHATASLRILGLSVFPIIIKNHYVAIRRVQRRVGGAAFAMAGGGLLEVALGAAGAALGGLSGLCVGWLIALCIEAALTAPVVYRIAGPGK